MQLSLIFIRLLFLGLCILLTTVLAIAEVPLEDFSMRLAIGTLSGSIMAGAVIGVDLLLKRFSLRSFNTVIIGLFVGYLMGSAMLLVMQTVLDIGGIKLGSHPELIVKTFVFLSACYLGMVLTARTSNELYASIPFVQLKTGNKSKKDILIDASALADPRTIDLAVSGLLDQSLIIPRFLVKELHEQADSSDESQRLKAKRAIEALKKLEALTSLELRYLDHNFNDVQDIGIKIARLARQLDACILTADTSRTQHTAEGIRYINLHALSNSMKPLAQNGESLNIKIQRYGKEPRQGVGYLDDGTMVVVNGGADYIGATIRAQVLSVKHTTSGRMIFCNAADADFFDEAALTGGGTESLNSPSNYFAV